jgi:signal transduction histidine kinase/CheY-like chemotaxis protein
MRQRRVRRRIIIVSGAVFFVFLGGSIIGFILAVRNHIEADIQSRIERIDNLFSIELKNEADQMSGYTHFLLRDGDFIQAWLSGDTEELKRLSGPVYNHINSEYNIKRLTIYTPDRLPFFSLHSSSGYTYSQDRFVNYAAVDGKAYAFGILIDTFGMPTISVFLPWNINGKIAGYVEVVKDIDHIIRHLSTFIDLELAVIVDKQFLDKSNWREGLSNDGITGNWDKYTDYVEMYSTVDIEPACLREYLNSAYPGIRINRIHIKSGGRNYRCGIVPLFDSGGRAVGNIIAFGEVSGEMSVIKLSMLYLICSSTAVIGALIVFLRFHFGRMENDLRKEVRQREKTEAELEKQVEHLARTREELLKMMEEMEESKRHSDVINIKLDKAVQEANRLTLEAELANKAKSEFLANMSHEIRTPLNAVIGFSDLLSSIIIDKKQKSYVDSINTAGKSLLSLINDILDLSKIEAGKLEMNYGRVNPRMIINELEQIFKEETEEKKLEFLIDVDEKLPDELILDETRLRQVLLNLLGNAVKFTEKGYVKLTARVLKMKKKNSTLDLVIEVEDTGIGIRKDQLDTVFESFRQQEGQSNRKYGGVGLGLAITRRLVGMMNGRISIRSEAGHGSVFKIVLMDVEIPDTGLDFQGPNIVTDVGNITFERAKILVVDDVKSNRLLVKELLARGGFDILEAEDGKEALSTAGENHPDLIIMDLRMPVMDGYEAASKLKKRPGTKDIPIIALTAFAQKSERSKASRYGFDGFLSKPVKIKELYGALSSHLKHSKRGENEGPDSLAEVAVKRISNNDIERISELIGVLNGDVMTSWNEISSIMEIDRIEDFSSILLRLSEEHKADSLSRYAKKLNDFVQYFDIKNIETTLAEFPLIVEEISRMNGENYGR